MRTKWGHAADNGDAVNSHSQYTFVLICVNNNNGRHLQKRFACKNEKKNLQRQQQLLVQRVILLCCFLRFQVSLGRYMVLGWCNKAIRRTSNVIKDCSLCLLLSLMAVVAVLQLQKKPLSYKHFIFNPLAFHLPTPVEQYVLFLINN